jgi:dephospho-CoA kinase
MLLAVLGKKSSGKDTFSNYLINHQGFIKYAFGDPLKKGIQCFFNLSDEQLTDEKLKEEIDERWGVSPRKLFQIIGTDIFQKSIYDFIPDLKLNTKNQNQNQNQNEIKGHWVYLFKEWYLNEIKKNPNVKVIVSDARFLHEIKTIKELNGIVIKIIRPPKENKNININDTHQSENEINDIPNEMIDNTIYNDKSIDELYNKIYNLIKKI